MLDWMKRLFKKEERTYVDDTPQADNPPTVEEYEPVQKEIEAKVAYQYPSGKFRFPLEVTEQDRYEEKQEPVQVEIPNPVPMQLQRRPRRSMMREQQEYVRPEPQQRIEETISVPVPMQKSNKRPFQPTEVASPVFGYHRPDYEAQRKQFELTEDIVLSEKGKSVVDEWLEKNGYIASKEQVEDELEAPNELQEEPLLDTVEQEISELLDEVEAEQEDTIPDDSELPASIEQAKEIIEYSSERVVESEPWIEPVVHNSLDKQAEIVNEEAKNSEQARNEEQAEPETVTTQSHKPQEFVKKAKTVPYNVLMMKQDRQRLADKQHTQATYTLPSLRLLEVPPHMETNDEKWLEEQQELLDTTFVNFNVGAKVVHMTQGPSVTRFEVQPDPGVKVNKITNLADDIKLNLAARDIRIEAPIPGKSAVGIEVPNQQSKPVFLREILRSPVFTKSESPLTVALGLDISGAPIVTDIRKMPHGLIAGATGSGKSVCINAILTSILYKAQPHEVKLMLIDPKMVELAPYNEIPHLVAPVITDAKAATAALKWAVQEMENRYEAFAHAGARDLTKYNELVKQKKAPGQELPYIVIVIDELADLMMVAAADVEEAICRIAQKARACGIHLLVATQRPSVDVITGLIKSNIPTRIAFTVSSQVDSRTIIDTGGAEKLLGRGDMLLLENGTSKTVRLQGVYVSDEEIERTVQHVKKQMKPSYLFLQEDLLTKTEQIESEDELFYEACQFVLEQGGASISSLQRRFRMGYNRAARLIDEMELMGIISEGRGSKQRDILITEADLVAMQDA